MQYFLYKEMISYYFSEDQTALMLAELRGRTDVANLLKTFQAEQLNKVIEIIEGFLAKVLANLVAQYR